MMLTQSGLLQFISKKTTAQECQSLNKTTCTFPGLSRLDGDEVSGYSWINEEDLCHCKTYSGLVESTNLLTFS